LEVFTEILNKSDIGLAETYINNLWNSKNIDQLIELAILNENVLSKAFIGNIHKIIYYRLKHEARENSKTGSRSNIKAHYDLGNNFYSLWLDPTMTYSSALFVKGNTNIEIAQNAKYQNMLDLVGAKPGEHIVEIGCGWGGFLEHAAKQGIKVTGITISDEQFHFAKERIEKLNLQQYAEVKICDYRDLEGQFDHAVSIEMIEAVGEKYWDSYFSLFKRVLKPGGKFAIQAITMDDKNFDSYRKGTDFIQQYVFPGGMLLSHKTIEKMLKKHDYEKIDQLYFGIDYAKTLNFWFNNFNQQIDLVKAQGFDEQFIRLWNFYLKYCEGAFNSKRIDVTQVVAKV
jgi:cyclopropane-fatty-acyl-phospholipid synthase